MVQWWYKEMEGQLRENGGQERFHNKKHWIRLFREEESFSWFNRREEFPAVELCKGR